MIWIYINSTDYTSYLENGSLTINDEIQQKANTCKFNLLGGTRPSDGQEVLIYDGTYIESLAGTTLTIKEDFSNTNKFRAGDTIWLGVGLATEESVTISSVSGKTITLSSAASDAHSEDEQMGKKIFGGTISKLKDYNLHNLANIEYEIDCIDFSKIFDKRLVNDVFTENTSGETVSRTALYIINRIVTDYVNYTHTIDDFEYANDGAIQAEWIESGDGDNPTVDTSNFKEGDVAGIFPWTNSGGTATFSATPASHNVSDFTGATSGAPTEGYIAFWYKQTDNTDVTSISLRYGSDSSNYTTVTLTPESDNNWHYAYLSLADGSETGTPDWTAADYCAIIVTETGSSNIIIDGLRINDNKSFRFDEYCDTGDTYDHFRVSFKKPTAVMERISEENQKYWYIDYNRKIHFFNSEDNGAPIGLSNTSNNFTDLSIEPDISQLKNRQVVRGGNDFSSSFYNEFKKGDDVTRTWVLRSKFKDLRVLTGTNSGSMTTLSVGIDNIDTENEYDYFGNFQMQSVRSAETTSTLTSNDIIKFRYKEQYPIRTIVQDNVSIETMKNTFGGDGVFEGDVITDQNIKSLDEAIDRGEAELTKYSNPIIKASFTTDQEGLKSGQVIQISDTYRNLDKPFIIQRVRQKVIERDYSTYEVTCASYLFGIVELLQKLLRTSGELAYGEDEVVDQIDVFYESLISTESWAQESRNIQRETVSCTESWSTFHTDSNFRWQTSSVEKLGAKWNLFSWGS